jgi:hypothetical protein
MHRAILARELAEKTLISGEITMVSVSSAELLGWQNTLASSFCLGKPGPIAFAERSRFSVWLTFTQNASARRVANVPAN